MSGPLTVQAVRAMVKRMPKPAGAGWTWPLHPKQVERYGLLQLAETLQLPRVNGTPEEVALDISRRATAKARGYVYVGAYVRCRPVRRRKA